MKGTRAKIFIIGLTLFIFSFSTSVQGGSLYRCVNSQGSIILTNNVPTDPDFKCTFAGDYKDLTPQERAEEQREVNAYRQRMRVVTAKQEAERNLAKAKQEAVNRSTNQESNNNKSKTPDSAYETKRKELRDNFNKAYREYEKEKHERLQHNGKQPSSREKSLRSAMFVAQEAEHAFLFSSENFEGTVIQTTITKKRSK
jgi:hypothetical protein